MYTIEHQTIRCPICHKGKFVDIKDSRGKNSVVCNVCRQVIILNWDNKTATAGVKIKHV